MLRFFRHILVFLVLAQNVICEMDDNFINDNGEEPTTQSYVFWPNATIPFYIHPQHFDHEQSMFVMSSLAYLAFKTCLKFAPVLTPPENDQHVLTFVNPTGIRKCGVDKAGHVKEGPHFVTLGYDCLKSPLIEMIFMRALGFPFEHNRAGRDQYIDVQFENIEQSAVELFTKDPKMPIELRSLPYDIDSVMHFGEREYSKNGHRTIIFKDHPAKRTQKRTGLSHLDLRRIEIVYGPECRQRDRQEKIELCMNFPGVVRRKREVISEDINLRVNRDITPAPEDIPNKLNSSIDDLGIENEVQEIIEQIYRVSSKALHNARAKYCNDTKQPLRTSTEKVFKNNSKPDLLGIVGLVTDYAKIIVDNAVANLTEFCLLTKNIEEYQRQKKLICPFYNGPNCRQTYRSTKSGPVKYSTQHRPVYIQSTKHYGQEYRPQFDPLRTSNVTDGVANDTKQGKGDEDTVILGDKKDDKKNRRKRAVEVGDTNDASVVTENETKATESLQIVKEALRMGTKVQIEKRKLESERRKYKRVDDDDDDYTERRIKKRGRKGQREKPETSKRKERSQGDRPLKYRKKPQFGRDISAEESEEKTIKVTSEEHRPSKMKASSEEEQPKKSEFKSDEERPKKVKVSSDEERPKKVKVSSDEERPMKVKVGSDEERPKKVKVSSDEERPKKVKNRSDEERPKNVEVSSDEEIPKKVKVGSEEERPIEAKDKDRSEEERPSKMKPTSEKAKPDDGQTDDEQTEKPLPMTVALSKHNQEFYNDRKWPNGVVRYMIKADPKYDSEVVKEKLEEVNSILKKKTCVRLEEISEEDATKYEDYLVVDTSADYITGRVGGKQNFGSLELFQGGQHKQHAAMMVMAMLGFYFELARHDRDKYVRVHLRHVRPDKLHHFELIRSDATLPLPYDYESATHPAWQFWRKIGKTGISSVATFKTKDPDGSVMKQLGQHLNLLSDLDIVKINSVYGIDCFKKLKKNRSSGKKTRGRDDD